MGLLSWAWTGDCSNSAPLPAATSMPGKENGYDRAGRVIPLLTVRVGHIRRYFQANDDYFVRQVSDRVEYTIEQKV